MAHTHSEAPLGYLTAHIALLAEAPKKTALDVACGRGRNALYLAQNGFAVTALEHNPEAIAHTREAAREAALPVTVTAIDLETPGAALPTGFGVVCVGYYLYRPLLPQIREAVMPGGFVMYESFLIDQHQRWGSPRRRAFAWEHNELLDAFTGFRIHHYQERVDAAAHSAVARIVAQRPPETG